VVWSVVGRDVTAGLSLVKVEHIEIQSLTMSEFLEILDRVEVLLRDDNAEAVDAADEIARYKSDRAHTEIIEKMLRQINAYNFDEALITLYLLRKMVVTDGG